MRVRVRVSPNPLPLPLPLPLTREVPLGNERHHALRLAPHVAPPPRAAPRDALIPGPAVEVLEREGRLVNLNGQNQ